MLKIKQEFKFKFSIYKTNVILHNIAVNLNATEKCLQIISMKEGKRMCEKGAVDWAIIRLEERVSSIQNIPMGQHAVRLPFQQALYQQ